MTARDGIDYQQLIALMRPCWHSWWFWLLVASVVLLCCYSAFRVRTRNMHRQRSWLEHQVRIRTTEVEQKNTLLQQQKDELERRRQEAENQMLEARQYQRETEKQKLEMEVQKEKLEQAHRNISVLSEIGREMTSTLDVEAAMNTVYQHVHHLMDARSFGIGFYREEEGVIEFPFSMEAGVRNAPYSRSVIDPHQLAVWCLTHRREVFINDLALEYEAYIGPDGLHTLSPRQMAGGSDYVMVQSLMYAPLLVNERVVGVLAVQSIDKNAYRLVHLNMLQTLAVYAAVGLDNARAYQHLEAAMLALRMTEMRLREQRTQVRRQTDALALANLNLQENDERLRLAKQKAEDATRQKSEFLANMSHEMRTPLAGVIGMLGFALRDVSLPVSTREHIVRGHSNALALMEIINDLLDFSKIEAGKLHLEQIDFSLHAMLDNVRQLFEEQALERKLDFEIELANDVPPFVHGDPARLRQVLVNLVGNAFKFTQNGSVTVLVERAGGASRANGAIQFSVQDSGIGIAREVLPRLFQKFEQADISTTRRYGGTGLGLAICRQLVELMDGKIHVVSRLGSGSTFTFVLPLAIGQAPPLPCLARLEPHSHRLHVLCADDVEVNQMILRWMLENLGHQVEIVANGALAVAACSVQRHDLILMDGRMPDMDGADATRLIRAGGPANAPVQDCDVMIVAVSANVGADDRLRFMAAGMNDFLGKPIDEAVLHGLLSRAIVRQLARGMPLPLMAPCVDVDAAPVRASSPVMPATPDGFEAMAGFVDRASESAARSLKQKLYAAFLADLEPRMAQLETARAKRDGAAAGRLLHGMKGSAAWLEETALYAVSAQLEQAADNGQWAVVDAVMPQLLQSLEKISAQC